MHHEHFWVHCILSWMSILHVSWDPSYGRNKWRRHQPVCICQYIFECWILSWGLWLVMRFNRECSTFWGFTSNEAFRWRGDWPNTMFININSTMFRSFFLSKIDYSDLLVEPKNFLPGNSGITMWSFSFETTFSISSCISLNSLYLSLEILDFCVV